MLCSGGDMKGDVETCLIQGVVSNSAVILIVLKSVSLVLLHKSPGPSHGDVFAKLMACSWPG